MDAHCPTCIQGQGPNTAQHCNVCHCIQKEKKKREPKSVNTSVFITHCLSMSFMYTVLGHVHVHDDMLLLLVTCHSFNHCGDSTCCT